MRKLEFISEDDISADDYIDFINKINSATHIKKCCEAVGVRRVHIFEYLLSIGWKGEGGVFIKQVNDVEVIISATTTDDELADVVSYIQQFASIEGQTNYGFYTTVLTMCGDLRNNYV